MMSGRRMLGRRVARRVLAVDHHLAVVPDQLRHRGTFGALEGPGIPLHYAIVSTSLGTQDSPSRGIMRAKRRRRSEMLSAISCAGLWITIHSLRRSSPGISDFGVAA